MTGPIQPGRIQQTPLGGVPALRLQPAEVKQAFLKNLLSTNGSIRNITLENIYQKILGQRSGFTQISSAAEAKEILRSLQEINELQLRENKPKDFWAAYQKISGESIQAEKQTDLLALYLTCRAFIEVFDGLLKIQNQLSLTDIKDIASLFYQAARESGYSEFIFENREITLSNPNGQDIVLKLPNLNETFKQINPSLHKIFSELFELNFLRVKANSASLRQLLFVLYDEQELNSLSVESLRIYQNIGQLPRYRALRQLQVIEGLGADGKNEKAIKKSLQTLKDGGQETDVAIEFPRAISILAQEENLSPAQKDLIYNASLVAIIECKEIHFSGLISEILGSLQGTNAVELKTRALQLMFLDRKGIFCLGVPALIEFLCTSQYVPAREDLSALEKTFPGLISTAKGTVQYARQHASQNNTGVIRLLNLKPSTQEQSTLTIPTTKEELVVFVETARKKETQQLDRLAKRLNQALSSNPQSVDLVKALGKLQNISYQLLSYNPDIEIIVKEYADVFSRAWPSQMAQAAAQIEAAARFVWGEFDRAPESIQRQYEGLRQRSEAKLAALEEHHLKALAAATPEEVERIIREDLANEISHEQTVLATTKILREKISSIAPTSDQAKTELDSWKEANNSLASKVVVPPNQKDNPLAQALYSIDISINTKNIEINNNILDIGLNTATSHAAKCTFISGFLKQWEQEKNLNILSLLAEKTLAEVQSLTSREATAIKEYQTVYTKINNAKNSLSIPPEFFPIGQKINADLEKINKHLNSINDASRETHQAISQQDVRDAVVDIQSPTAPTPSAPQKVEPSTLVPLEAPLATPVVAPTPTAQKPAQKHPIEEAIREILALDPQTKDFGALALRIQTIAEKNIQDTKLNAQFIRDALQKINDHANRVETEQNCISLEAALEAAQRIANANNIYNLTDSFEHSQKLINARRKALQKKTEPSLPPVVTPPAPGPVTPPPVSSDKLIGDTPEESLEKAKAYLANPNNLKSEKIKELLISLNKQIEEIIKIQNPALNDYRSRMCCYILTIINQVIKSLGSEEKLPDSIRKAIRLLLNKITLIEEEIEEIK